MLFPSAKFIHILRNPNAVARSLMKFSQAGDAGRDYSEPEAYATWQRMTESILTGELAFGNKKVLRILYEDLVKNLEITFRKCLNFVGEQFSPDCLLPLREKINSSNIDPVKLTSPNPKSGKGAKANHFYQSILNEKSVSVPDIDAQKYLADQFQKSAQTANTDSKSMLSKVIGKLYRSLKFNRNHKL